MVFFSILTFCLVLNVEAAVPSQRRSQTVLSSSDTISPTSARAATIRTTSARSATPSISNRTTSARSGSVPVTSQTVSARAATTQKVINSGTKISAATRNTVVNEACQQKYFGCMDSFCMIENTSGGRCLCSDRKAELDKVLTQIQSLDAQSYKMATEGVEKIEMGANADAAIAAAQNSEKSITDANQNNRSRTLDLNLWNQTGDTSEDIFAEKEVSPIDGKTGDDLYNSVNQICISQLPECANDMSMLQMMYSQNIKSDCAAYENDLNSQKNSSATKLAAAQKALRDAALDSLRTANKYDLGQCTIEFKKCMANTAGCKDDFTGCVGIAAAENAKKSTSSKSSIKMVDIKGSSTKISVAASTMDALESKKPMCDNITNSCVAVKDQVWDTFLREVAPTLKTAELLAESDLRTNCISNISQCFQKACKDTIDPNDPDGSYDMCLSRPETVRSLCKVQIDPCVSAEPLIMDYVYARLSSMRVDSCTTEVKQCLESEDRCGSDYSKCVGLDTDTIIRMCPYDKLTGCQKVYSSTKVGNDIRGDAVYEELSTMVQGIMLNIDNSFQSVCQKALDESMIKVCGSTDDCNGLTVDDGLGSRSLEYKVCQYTGNSSNLSINYNLCRADVSQITDGELRSDVPYAGILDGNIYWENIEVKDDGTLTNVDDYITASDTELSDTEKNKVETELSALEKNINSAIKTVEADPTVQYCMTGRQVQGMNNLKIGKEGQARFPNLTDQVRLVIANSALKTVKANYYKKYDELSKKILEDYKVVADRVDALENQDKKDAHRDAARKACISMVNVSVISNNSSINNSRSSVENTLISLINGWAMPFMSVNSTNVTYDADQISKLQMVGSKQYSSLREKQMITSTFNWETLNCHKCIRSQRCTNVKNPLFGSKYCKSWSAEKEECTDTQF